MHSPDLIKSTILNSVQLVLITLKKKYGNKKVLLFIYLVDNNIVMRII